MSQEKSECVDRQAVLEPSNFECLEDDKFMTGLEETKGRAIRV